MMDDIVLNKKEDVERCVQRVKAYYAEASDLPFEQDFLKQDAIALNIQRAAELCIDLPNHVVKTLKLGIPYSTQRSGELFRRRFTGQDDGLAGDAVFLTRNLPASDGVAARVDSHSGDKNTLLHENIPGNSKCLLNKD